MSGRVHPSGRLLATAPLLWAAACSPASPAPPPAEAVVLDAPAVLVAEAERRGLDRSAAVRRAEKRALAQLVLRDVEATVGPEAIPPGALAPSPGEEPGPREHRLVAYVRLEPREGAALEEDALALANEVLARIERQGLEPVLEALGSRPPSHPRYRYVVEEAVVVPRRDDGPGTLREAIFGAEGVGPIAPAFRTGRGAYAAYVLAIWPDVRPTPEAARAEREPSALAALRAQATAELLDALRASASVRFDEEALAPVLGNAASSD